MGRNPEANAEQRAESRRRLMAAGLELMATRGLDGTTVDAVVAEAGCSKGLFYCYFPTKQALAEAILTDWLAAVSQLATDDDPEATPGQRLAGFARRMASYVEANPDAYRLYLGALTDPGLRQLAGALTIDRPGAAEAWMASFPSSDAPDLDGLLFQTSLLGIFAHHVLSPRPTPVTELVERLIQQRLEVR